MGDELRLTPSETVTIRESSAELLEVEGSWEPRGKPPPAHYHPAQDERFEVLEGTLMARVAGRQHVLQAGESLDIPRGTPHQIWNAGAEPMRALWQTRPRLRTDAWFRSIDRLFREGKVGRGGTPGPLAYGTYLSEYDDVFRLAGPRIANRPLVAVLGVMGRAKGYRPGPS